MLAFSAVSLLFLYLIERIQHWLPYSNGQPNVPPALAWNTAASFTNGVGLGLALSRGFTEAMGGTLSAEETPGGGLTMTLSLPAAGAAGPGGYEPGHRERGDGDHEPGHRERAAGLPPVRRPAR